ncbi:cation transporter [Kipferlia bialata]|uniref:Cation transporter n=1 Tax=Kipferlia bialata TaxID=797122 RepID=A0A9K3CQT5_9EUKA|nr:cation transporter [Kipferlia bialata]|eukprot:g2461.t1
MGKVIKWCVVYQLGVYALGTVLMSGYSLFAENLVPYACHPFILFCLSGLVVAGNTLYPCLFRVLVSVRSGMSISWKAVYLYLLQRPSESWLLLWAWLGMTGWECLVFTVFEVGNPDLEGLNIVARFAVNLFTATSTRGSGFAALSYRNLDTATAVTYTVMMIIGVYPFISILHTTMTQPVGDTDYDEEEEEAVGSSDDDRERDGWEEGRWDRGVDESLLVYKHHGQYDVSESSRWQGFTDAVSYITRIYTEETVTRDLAVIWFFWLLICTFDSQTLKTDTYASEFDVLFEVVTAFGNVGCSMGYPGTNYAFSYALQPMSRVCIIAVALLGRNRGLPMNVDAAMDFNRAVSISLDPIALNDAQVGVSTSEAGAGAGADTSVTHMEMDRERERELVMGWGQL